MRRHPLYLVVLALGLAGALSACKVDRDSFPDRYADRYCDRLHECARGKYDAAYESRSECVDDVADDVDDTLDFTEGLFPGCELDVDGAGECLDQIHDATCADFVSGSFDGACGSDLLDC